MEANSVRVRLLKTCASYLSSGDSPENKVLRGVHEMNQFLIKFPGWPWSTIWAAGNALATLLLAVFAFLAWQEAQRGTAALHEQIKTMEKTRIENLRAWIAPRGGEFAGPIKLNRVLRMRVLYENTGKLPALDVRHSSGHAFLIPIEENSHGEAFIDWSKVGWLSSSNRTCENLASGTGDQGMTVYPSARGKPYASLLYVFTGGPYNTVPEPFIKARETFAIMGCFSYRTLNLISYSAYCIYVQPYTDREPKDWTFEFCPNGNYSRTKINTGDKS